MWPSDAFDEHAGASWVEVFVLAGLLHEANDIEELHEGIALGGGSRRWKSVALLVGAESGIVLGDDGFEKSQGSCRRS